MWTYSSLSSPHFPISYVNEGNQISFSFLFFEFVQPKQIVSLYWAVEYHEYLDNYDFRNTIQLWTETWDLGNYRGVGRQMGQYLGRTKKN